MPVHVSVEDLPVVALTAACGGSTLDAPWTRCHLNVTGRVTSLLTVHVRVTGCPATTATVGFTVTVVIGTRIKKVTQRRHHRKRKRSQSRLVESPASDSEKLEVIHSYLSARRVTRSIETKSAQQNYLL